MTNKQALISALLHVAEWVVIVAVLYALYRLGWVTTEQVQVVVGLVMAAIMMFLRQSNSSPVPDYIASATTVADKALSSSNQP